MRLADGEESSWVSNEVRDQCFCIVVGADRRLSYQLSYSSKYTFLSRLMRRFHEALTEDSDRVDGLRGAFEEIKAIFEGVGPFALFASELQRQVGELSGNLEYGLSVDFSAYDPSNYFHALRLMPYERNSALSFAELGTGQEQILAISFAYAYAKAFHGQAGNLVLVVEEPEAHLHPLAQQWMAKKINEAASEGVQVVVTTHSPAFLDVLKLDGFAVLRKAAGSTHVIQASRTERRPRMFCRFMLLPPHRMF
jgi:putative ATP-dependent endonuclease of OLD family